MQASVQESSVSLGNLLQGPVSSASSSTSSLGQSQVVGTEGENPGKEFLASLESSLQALSQGEQSPLVPFDPSQLMATIQQYLDGQGQLPGGKGLPLDELIAAAGGDELTPELRDLMARLRTLLANGGTADPTTNITTDITNATVISAAAGESQAPTSAESLDTLLTPVAAGEVKQVAVDQRRLLERFQSLPEVRQLAAELPAGALKQILGRLGQQSDSQTQQAASSALSQQSTGWLGGMKTDLALTPAVQPDDFALQLSRMVEMKGAAMSAHDGAALDSMVKGNMADVSSLSSATVQRQANPATPGSEARPASAFIQTPLHDPQWQSDFSNRVTWLARAGGNQTAEIRLNPANMGPIEVKVVMKDDQATITFTAQHGVVRDAIESSLPRLREMFSGSGLQLAQASVSDQSLQDPRQRQPQGFDSRGGGGSQGWYGQDEEFGDLVSPISLSATSPASMLADSVDLYA